MPARAKLISNSHYFYSHILSVPKILQLNYQTMFNLRNSLPFKRTYASITVKPSTVYSWYTIIKKSFRKIQSQIMGGVKRWGSYCPVDWCLFHLKLIGSSAIFKFDATKFKVTRMPKWTSVKLISFWSFADKEVRRTGKLICIKIIRFIIRQPEEDSTSY